MQRRRFLKAAAATPLIILIPWASFAQLARPGGTFRRVRPSDPAWPGAASWDELNHPVDGALIKVAPLLAPCSTWLPGRTCLDVLQNARNPFYLGDQPAGTQVSGWLDAWTPEASAFAVRARSTAHVVAAVNFARQNNLGLVVKGGGHSYQGTSNAPDSLLVWTREGLFFVHHGVGVEEWSDDGSRQGAAARPLGRQAGSATRTSPFTPAWGGCADVSPEPAANRLLRALAPVLA